MSTSSSGVWSAEPAHTGRGAEGHPDPAHLGEVRPDIHGQHGLRVPAPGRLGDAQREAAHPLDVTGAVDGGPDDPQIGGDRSLQGEQHERHLLGPPAMPSSRSW
jgi:hypothetical protein